MKTSEGERSFQERHYRRLFEWSDEGNGKAAHDKGKKKKGGDADQGDDDLGKGSASKSEVNGRSKEAKELNKSDVDPDQCDKYHKQDSADVDLEHGVFK